MKTIAPLALTLPLLACSALVRPDFYGMSEAELAEYNQSLPAPEQVQCIEVQASPDQAGWKLCGTVAEITSALAPVAPGAQQTTETIYLRGGRSRATNPPLTPITQPRIQQ